MPQSTLSNSTQHASHQKYWVVVPAAGVGSRMGADIPKQYLSLQNNQAKHTVLEQTIQRLLLAPSIVGVVVSISKNDKHWDKLAISKHSKVFSVEGGKERMHSVHKALLWLMGQNASDPFGFQSQVRPQDSTLSERDFVLVHDAVRPCVQVDDIEKLIDTLSKHEVGGLLASPLVDTLKLADSSGRVVETLSRDNCWRAQTPQMFRLGLLKKSIEAKLHRNELAGDEASSIEALGLQAQIIEGAADNLKLTVPSDLALLESILSEQAKPFT